MTVGVQRGGPVILDADEGGSQQPWYEIGHLLESYGWFILLGFLSFYYLYHRYSEYSYRQNSQRFQAQKQAELDEKVRQRRQEQQLLWEINSTKIYESEKNVKHEKEKERLFDNPNKAKKITADSWSIFDESKTNQQGNGPRRGAMRYQEGGSCRNPGKKKENKFKKEDEKREST